MATIEQKIASGELEKYEANLKPRELVDRIIYYSPDLTKWISNDLQQANRDFDQHLDPLDQVVILFDEFVAGRPMTFGFQIKKLASLNDYVWEMRPTDVRIFGYFYRKSIFIAVCGELKKNLTKNALYKPFIAEVVNFSKNINLDRPEKIMETRLKDVL
jgi:hypothetical protein